jgi:hypothetical protein
VGSPAECEYFLALKRDFHKYTRHLPKAWRPALPAFTPMLEAEKAALQADMDALRRQRNHFATEFVWLTQRGEKKARYDASRAEPAPAGGVPLAAFGQRASAGEREAKLKAAEWDELKLQLYARFQREFFAGLANEAKARMASRPAVNHRIPCT